MLAVILLLFGYGSVAAAELRVGAAAVNLEADDSMTIAGGIGPGRAIGQEGQLRAVAVVLEQPRGNKLAIVACDVLFVARDFLDPALAEIESLTGIPAAHVLVNATHTHHAPSVTRVHGYERDEKFYRRVTEGIVEAVRQANDRLPFGDAKFYFHLAQENTIGRNSRLLLDDGMIYWIGDASKAVRPTGPFDPELPVLAFGPSKERLLALIYNHSTHTIGTASGAVRSPGFYGLAAQELERPMSGVVSFLEGASGSTHNLTMGATEASVRLQSVIRESLNAATERPIDRLQAVKRPFRFRVRQFDEQVEEQKAVTYCKKYAPGSADAFAAVFRKMRSELASHQGEARETWLQVMLVGDVAIVGVPAEYFTSLGVDIKRRSPFEHTYIAELANDWIGYLPDREGHKLGGYQTWMGLHSYAELGTGERVADEILSMLEELADK